MADPVMLFVVEGEDRDYRLAGDLRDSFFATGRYRTRLIRLSARENLYMLYRQLAEYDFEADLVEILRETVPEAKTELDGISRQDIAEIYLFFDYDIHQNNLPEGQNGEAVLAELLSVFSNETENGKLYISYPMVEALYDLRRDSCQAFSRCFLDAADVVDYKHLSGNENPMASRHFRFDDWKQAVNVFALRLRCLLELQSEELNAAFYRRSITPLLLYQRESELWKESRRVFILSGLPEFLLDYFRDDFWHANVRRTRYAFEQCPHGRTAGK